MSKEPVIEHLDVFGKPRFFAFCDKRILSAALAFRLVMNCHGAFSTGQLGATFAMMGPLLSYSQPCALVAR